VTSHTTLKNYPFRDTTTKENTLLDFYHLLPGLTKTSNTPCIFTNLGKQDVGVFGFKNDLNGQMGPLEIEVFRSFRYAQTDDFEEFKNEKGISYWYVSLIFENIYISPTTYLLNIP